jgi:CheY-like chemotaxis protein
MLGEHVTTAASPINILLVEDHRDTARSMAKLLERCGYTISTASCIADARELAAQQRFQLMLCDVGLPDGDGVSLLAHVRAMYPIAGIAISGYGMEKDVDRSLEAGFHQHLLKPVAFDDLVQAIERATKAVGDIEPDATVTVAAEPPAGTGR